jgi:hypothetical protein
MFGESQFLSKIVLKNGKLQITLHTKKFEGNSLIFSNIVPKDGNHQIHFHTISSVIP